MEKWRDRCARDRCKSDALFYARVTLHKAPVRIGSSKKPTAFQLRPADALEAQKTRLSSSAFYSPRTADGRVSQERNRNALGAVARGLYREGAARHGLPHGRG